MILNQVQREELELAALPLMLWLEANCHPHCSAIVDSERCEVVEGIALTKRSESVLDRYFLGIDLAKDGADHTGGN